ncbi:hypothetical protein M5E84_03295 [[Ruminococcus] torques]|nr:hypothetical protein M5E84_03295 [[Ruminococcus] torques]
MPIQHLYRKSAAAVSPAAMPAAASLTEGISRFFNKEKKQDDEKNSSRLFDKL